MVVPRLQPKNSPLSRQQPELTSKTGAEEFSFGRGIILYFDIRRGQLFRMNARLRTLLCDSVLPCTAHNMEKAEKVKS